LSSTAQPDLEQIRGFSPGFRYSPDLLSVEEECALVQKLEPLPFKEFEFQGILGKRRVVWFGWRYDFNGGGFSKAKPLSRRGRLDRSSR